MTKMDVLNHTGECVVRMSSAGELQDLHKRCKVDDMNAQGTFKLWNENLVELS